MKKTQLLTRMADAYEAMEGLLATLDDAALSQVTDAAGWAVKDHLFHLAMWERGVAWLLGGRSRNEGMGITDPQWEELTMDEQNNLTYERTRERPAAEALAAFRGAHREMLDALAPLSDEDLQLPYSDFDPAATQGADRPIIGWIIGDTYDHYDEHRGWIEALLRAS
ncbi:MAG: ClbS/DfsB family four-helix bundle protein [Candidatus Promineofilum sp.]|nr:ClbS/DfsB family four-helix bundle protein [Promineifilum sp.]MCW5864364.1 maleylpyruvate isomerase N-terminal domain-containing protein [Anaerolineae bacterium]